MVHLSNAQNSQIMKLYFLIGLGLYKAKGLSQALLIFITASSAVPLIETFKKFIIPVSFDNWVIFLILVILDTLSGLYKHSGLWAKEAENTLNKDEFFLKLFRKVFIGAVWLIMINVILNLDQSSDYFNSFGVGVLISWLGWSIASNLHVVSGSTFPPKWVLDKFRKDNEQ